MDIKKSKPPQNKLAPPRRGVVTASFLLSMVRRTSLACTTIELTQQNREEMDELAAVVSCSPTPQPVLPADIRATDMSLRLKSNVIYLVAGVVIQDGKVLLIQECKISFKNKWYLPAGRMERGESIVEAVKREVLEESGFEFEPEALVAVQRMDRKRVRFGVAGRIIGGILKTVADAESVQGGWFTTDTQQLSKELKLRNDSIIPLIDVAREWFANRPYTGLPVNVPHISSSQRLVMVHDEAGEMKVLFSKEEGGTTRLPACLIHRDTLFSRVDHTTTLDSAVKKCGYEGEYRDCGVMSLEHSDQAGFDGLCLTCVLATASLHLSPDSGYQWTIVSEPGCVERLRLAIGEVTRGCALFT